MSYKYLSYHLPEDQLDGYKVVVYETIVNQVIHLGYFSCNGNMLKCASGLAGDEVICLLHDIMDLSFLRYNHLVCHS